MKKRLVICLLSVYALSACDGIWGELFMTKSAYPDARQASVQHLREHLYAIDSLVDADPALYVRDLFQDSQLGEDTVRLMLWTYFNDLLEREARRYRTRVAILREKNNELLRKQTLLMDALQEAMRKDATRAQLQQRFDTLFQRTDLRALYLQGQVGGMLQGELEKAIVKHYLEEAEKNARLKKKRQASEQASEDRYSH